MLKVAFEPKKGKNGLQEEHFKCGGQLQRMLLIFDI